jgi:hypothetical protein
VRRVRANSVRFAAVVAALALSLLVVTAVYADTPATDAPDTPDASDRTETALDGAADADTNAGEGEETVAENEQTLSGDGGAQDDEVSIEQTDRDDEDAKVRKAQRDRDCGSFDTQEQAQSHFNEQGGSTENNADNLDDDGDGLACEGLASGDAPLGGADTGGGGTAPPPNAGSSTGPAPFVLGGAALGLLLALLGPSLRRRSTT